MYLHIGDNFSIPMNSILTMIHAESGKHHRTGISHYDAEVIYIVPEDKVKTYIVSATITRGVQLLSASIQ